ncbi:MAG: MFS transporter [Nitrospirae bacterium]|nr:MAG: MFS transporter [Nitrospirota bacterium]
MVRDEVLADSDDQARFCLARGNYTKRGAWDESLAPAFWARFWIDLAQSTGVPSWRRYLEPCSPLVRVCDYWLAGKNHHHRTPAYDTAHRARSHYRRLCGPVAEKILPRRIERVASCADRNHSLRHPDRQLHGQSCVCHCPTRRDGGVDLQSGADLVGASDCSARAIHGSECSHPEYDQPGYHFRSGIERDRHRLFRLTAGFYGFGASALTTLFPVFARKLLDLGPVEVGYLWSALGVGLLLMSMVLLRFTEWNISDRTRIIAGASVASALGIGLLVWTKDLFLVGLLMVVIGGGMGAFTPIAWGIVQELTPGNLVGRVMSLYSTGAMTAAISGISIFGWVTERFGESTGVTGIGATFLLTASLGGWLSWSIRNR